MARSARGFGTLGIGLGLGVLLGPAAAFAGKGNLVLSHVKLDDTSLGGALVSGAQFGFAVAGIGDVNGDGFADETQPLADEILRPLRNRLNEITLGELWAGLAVAPSEGAAA